MSILKSRVFWAALALPAAIWWLNGTYGVLSYAIFWSPCSLLLLLVALMARKNKNLKVALSRNEKMQETDVHSRKFYFYDKVYSFFEIIADTAQESDGKYVWTKTKAGREKKVSTNGVSFRKGHVIKVYELRETYKNGGYSTYEDAVILNDNTNEYETKINKNIFKLPIYITYLMYTLFFSCVISFLFFAFNLSYWPVFLGLTFLLLVLVKWCNKLESEFFSQIESLASSLKHSVK